VFKNGVVRRIFGLNRVKVIGVYRKLLNEELYSLCTSPSIIRMKSRRMGWACSMHGE
jgi:hypothetical protein